MAMTIRSPAVDIETIRVPLPTGGVTAGQFKTVGQVVGFVHSSVTTELGTYELSKSDDSYALIIKCPKLELDITGATIAQGAFAYWNAGTSKVTATDTTGFPLIGTFNKAVTSADTTAEINFDGSLFTSA